MIQTVENFIKQNDIQNKNVILGFSSGPDSCALALILDKLKEKYNLNLILAYFNHGWREEESKQEEVFTAEFAKKINAQFCLGQAAKNIKKTENDARESRYSFFEECAEKFKTDIVFLAHNKNDNIETLVYRLIKGTSPKGLCAIPEIRDIYYRPLLEIEKRDILSFLKENNQNYMTDSSNKDIKYKRNLIREEILPLFEKINPSYINSINNLIKTSKAANKIVQKEILNIKNKIINDNKIDYDSFTELECEVRYEILNDYLKEELKIRDYKTIEKLDNFILSSRYSKTSIGANTFLRTRRNKIFIEKREVE